MFFTEKLKLIIDYLLCSSNAPKRNLRRHCRFIWSDKTGSKNPFNNTYDGAIGLVASSTADAYIVNVKFQSELFTWAVINTERFSSLINRPLDLHAVDEQAVVPSSLMHSANYILGWLAYSLNIIQD